MEKRIYIIGAGFAGQTIADDIKRKKIFGKVNAFLDDDKNLIGSVIDGIPVLGPIDSVASILTNSDSDDVNVPNFGVAGLPKSNSILDGEIYFSTDKAEYL